MASTISNPVLTQNNHRKRKKKTTIKESHNTNNPIEWKSEKQQQTYSTRLLKALSQLRINEADSGTNVPRRGRAVREAADRALAVAAKGRTRWSRAILMNRIKVKFRKVKRQRGSAAAAGGGASRAKKPKVSVLALKGKNLPAVQRKVKVLGKLVPGCKKEDFPVILEEATDYIAALEMQVKAMSALAELLSGGASAFPSVPPS